MISMKILFVITGLGVGGAEKVVTSLADKLVEKGHTVKIAYLTGPDLTLPSNPNIEVIPLNVISKISLPQAYFKLVRLIKNFKPDVVHSHMFHANIFSRLIRLNINIPVLVCTAHNTNEGGKIRMMAYRVTDRLANINTNVSKEAVDAFVVKGATPAGRMISVVNGIDTEKFYYDIVARDSMSIKSTIKQNKLLLAVGRLESQKDYPNLLNAISLLKNDRQDFHLFIVGDGVLKDDLEILIDRLSISDCVSLLGIRQDIRELMSSTDAFVLSSAWEGFGLVVAEAMACERVVVATDSGGVKEVMGDAGFLVTTNNSQELAIALNKVLDMDKNELEEMGTKARRRIIKHYSLDAAVERWLSIYSSFNDK